jgi:hypothetical protein
VLALVHSACLYVIPSFSASDNIPKADAIRTLIKDLWDTRMAKLRVSADSFVQQQEAHAKVGGVCPSSTAVHLAPIGSAASFDIAEKFQIAYCPLRLLQAQIISCAVQNSLGPGCDSVVVLPNTQKHKALGSILRPKTRDHLKLFSVVSLLLNQELLGLLGLLSCFSWIT